MEASPVLYMHSLWITQETFYTISVHPDFKLISCHDH
jgi:hypothetical protein